MKKSRKIIEQGAFSELNVPRRYIYSLNVHHLQSASGREDEIRPVEDNTETKNLPAKTEDKDSSRQT
jgi:hypothetical protein